MVMAEAKVKEWGNSLGIIIPSELTKIEDIKAGDIIRVDIIKPKSSGFGIWKNKPYRPFTRDQDDHEAF